MSGEVPLDASKGAGPARSAAPPPAVLWALAILLAGWILYLARDILVIIILAGLLAYIINPLVKLAESISIKRQAAAAFVYLGIFFSLAATAYFVYPRIAAEASTLFYGSPSLTQRLDGAIDTLEGEIVARFPEARSLFGAPETRYARLNAFVQEQLSHLPDLLSHMASVMLAVFLVPLFSFFLLRDSRRMIRLLMDHLPPRHVETSVAVWCEIDRIMGRYLRGLAIDGLIVGTTVATGLWILGVNYPLLLGAISGMANVIPYVGPVICEVTIIVIVVLQFHSLGPVLNILAFYLCLKFCDMTLIHPMSVGKAVHLHPVLLIASVLVGGHAFGLIGMIVAVPTVTIVQEVARLLLERRRPRSLAGGRPEENIFVQPIVC